MPNLLAPITHALATVLATTHTVLTHRGLDPDSALCWVLAITGLVIVIRTLILPITVHSVRLARASATARPALDEIRKRYAGRTDVESLTALRLETRAVQADHGVSRLGCLPSLIQLAVLLALYQLLSQVSTLHSVGAMTAEHVESLGSAGILGVGLTDRLGSITTWFDSPTHLLVVVGLATVSAALGYATQRWFVLPNMVFTGMPGPIADAQRLMPALSAVGMLFAAGAVPVGLLIYWVVSNAYTLAQQAVVTTWYPTPGSPAHARRHTPTTT